MIMKTIIFYLAIIVTISLSKKSKLRQNNVNPGCIRAYPECEFHGKGVDLCGKQSIKSLKGQKIKSFYLGPNSKVFIYEGDLNGFNDIKIEEEECYENFEIASLSVGISGNDEYDVPMYCARLWEECDFKGDYIDICGELDLYQHTSYNDFGQSLQLGKHTKAIIYKDDGFHGNSLEVLENIGCFGDDWQFNVSSVKVEKFVSFR